MVSDSQATPAALWISTAYAADAINSMIFIGYLLGARNPNGGQQKRPNRVTDGSSNPLTFYQLQNLVAMQAVNPFQRCGAIGFCHGGVIKDGVHKIADVISAARLIHDGLADMDNL